MAETADRSQLCRGRELFISHKARGCVMDAVHLSVKAKDKASVGYEVVTATNGGDAMAIPERRTDIDILFTDVVMPKGMSGLQLAYLAHKLRPDPKMVIGTGYPLRTVREQYGRIDDFAFANKPYRLAEPAKALRAAGEGLQLTLYPTYTVGHRPLRKGTDWPNWDFAVLEN